MKTITDKQKQTLLDKLYRESDRVLKMRNEFAKYVKFDEYGNLDEDNDASLKEIYWGLDAAAASIEQAIENINF